MSKLLKEWNKLAFTKRGKTLNESMGMQTLDEKYIDSHGSAAGDAFEKEIEAATNGAVECGWTGVGWVCGFRDGCCVEPIVDSWERDIVELYISIDENKFYCYMLNNRLPCIVANSEQDLISQLNGLVSSGVLPFQTEDDAHAYTEQQGLQRPPY